MKDKIELLNYIYKNSKMSLIEIDEIKPSINDKELMKVLKAQEKNYFTVCTKIAEMLINLKHEPEEISSISRVITFIDLRLNTMNNSSPNNIAKTLIESTTKSIIELQQKINNHHGKTTKVIRIANSLLRAKQRTVNCLKKFL